MTTKFCVVGSPIQHSFSPAIHKAAYSLLGLDFDFDKLEVPPGRLKGVLEDKSISGLSVTMPLKYEAFRLAETSSVEALKTGVANTLLRSSNGWIGHNTDVHGFEKCFRQVPAAESITIVGSGATARSAVLAMSRVFPSAKLSVVGRSMQSVSDLLEAISAFGMDASEVKPDTSSVVHADLVVSTVPGSAFSQLWENLGPDTGATRGFLFDVAYDPWPSRACQAWGENTISGLELLIWQAIEQVKLFATSVGSVIQADDQELYLAMKTAAAQQLGLK